MNKKIDLFIQLLEAKRYSSNSIETYTNAFRQFLMYFKDVNSLNEKQINKFALTNQDLGFVTNGL